MTDQDEFYTSPGSEIEPGDIFLDIFFPALKYPLAYFRINYTKNNKVGHLLTPEESKVQPGDSPRGSVEPRTVMLVSHGCEVERVLRSEDSTKRHWLAAPVLPLEKCASEKMKDRVRKGTQPNRFYLPPTDYLRGGEWQVDLRKITPINCQFFVDADVNGRRLCSLSETAKLELHSQLGVFFSGLALYIQSIPCPSCGAEIDPTLFQVESGQEPDDE